MTLQCLKTMQERNLYLQGMLCMWSEKTLCPARVELIIKMIVVLIISCRGTCIMNIFLSLLEVLNIENYSLGKCKHESVTFTTETFNIKCHKFA